jgi:hypothetical protein
VPTLPREETSAQPVANATPAPPASRGSTAVVDQAESNRALPTKTVALYVAPISEQRHTSFVEWVRDATTSMTMVFQRNNDIVMPQGSTHNPRNRAYLEASLFGVTWRVPVHSSALERRQYVLANVYGLTSQRDVEIVPKLVEVIKASPGWQAQALRGNDFNSALHGIFKSAVTKPVDYTLGLDAELVENSVCYAINEKYLAFYRECEVTPRARVAHKFAPSYRNGRPRAVPAQSATPDFLRALLPTGA